jgi:hypothetical protein
MSMTYIAGRGGMDVADIGLLAGWWGAVLEAICVCIKDAGEVEQVVLQCPLLLQGRR